MLKTLEEATLKDGGFAWHDHRCWVSPCVGRGREGGLRGVRAT